MHQPLGEVFGEPAYVTDAATHAARKLHPCPFNDRATRCTKDKAKNPLGVCSILDNSGQLVITCPSRFREKWIIAENAAQFFFGPSAKFVCLPEVRLQDAAGKSAGNIDLILAKLDLNNMIIDFGTVEIQSVYISGNVREPFKKYMGNPSRYMATSWAGKHSPRPDFLSSSRKRLAPQITYKGTIVNSWGKKQAIAIDEPFFKTLPSMTEVLPSKADLAWFIYKVDITVTPHTLKLSRIVYTQFSEVLRRVSVPAIGELADFLDQLNERVASL